MTDDEFKAEIAVQIGMLTAAIRVQAFEITRKVKLIDRLQDLTAELDAMSAAEKAEEPNLWDAEVGAEALLHEGGERASVRAAQHGAREAERLAQMRLEENELLVDGARLTPWSADATKMRDKLYGTSPVQDTVDAIAPEHETEGAAERAEQDPLRTTEEATAGLEQDGLLVPEGSGAASEEAGKPALDDAPASDETPDHPGMEPGADASGAESPSVEGEAGGVVKAPPVDPLDSSLIAEGTPGAPAGISALAGVDMATAPDRSAEVTVQDGKIIGVAEVEPADESLTEQVPHLWSTTLLTENQIARRLKCTLSLVRMAMETARADGDPRMKARDSRKYKLSTEARKIMDRPASAPAPAAKEEREMPMQGQSKPPAPKPFSRKSPGVEIGEFVLPSPSEHIKTGICVVDLQRSKIFGRWGAWSTVECVARTVVELNGGECFSTAVIANRCGWADESTLLRWMTPMMENLRDIGMDLTNIRGVGMHMKLAEKRGG